MHIVSRLFLERALSPPQRGDLHSDHFSNMRDSSSSDDSDDTSPTEVESLARDMERINPDSHRTLQTLALGNSNQPQRKIRWRLFSSKKGTPSLLVPHRLLLTLFLEVSTSHTHLSSGRGCVAICLQSQQVIPHKLTDKPSALGLHLTLCDWLLDFLTGRPQSVRIGNRTSASMITNIGTSQGCVLSPILYTTLTHDCVISHKDNEDWTATVCFPSLWVEGCLHVKGSQSH